MDDFSHDEVMLAETPGRSFGVLNRVALAEPHGTGGREWPPVEILLPDGLSPRNARRRDGDSRPSNCSSSAMSASSCWVRQRLLTIYERRGWEALGYETVYDYCDTVLGLKRRRFYQVIEAAQVERVVVQNFALPPIPEKPAAPPRQADPYRAEARPGRKRSPRRPTGSSRRGTSQRKARRCRLAARAGAAPAGFGALGPGSLEPGTRGLLANGSARLEGCREPDAFPRSMGAGVGHSGSNTGSKGPIARASDSKSGGDAGELNSRSSEGRLRIVLQAFPPMGVSLANCDGGPHVRQPADESFASAIGVSSRHPGFCDAPSRRYQAGLREGQPLLWFKQRVRVGDYCHLFLAA